MIQQPIIPRVPIALQTSAGVTIDPVTGIVTINPAALTAANAVQILQAAAPGLPTADPHVQGQAFLNGGVVCISQG